jgi:phage-related protein
MRVYPATSTTEHADDGPSLTERASGAVGGAAQGAGDAARSVADSVTGAARSVADSVGGAAERAAEAAGSAWRGVTVAASSAAEGVGSTASSAARSVTETGTALHGQAREGLGWMIREQPLVLGAIGVALGAAVGALLPGTETEDRLMGETRDSLVDQASTVAQQGYERIKDTAGEHLGRAQQAVGEAADQGGVSRLGEAVGEAARAAREAVREAAHDLAGEAKSAIGTGDEGQQRTAGAASTPSQPGGPQASGPQRGGGGPV